jgi:hypothetical protein
VEKKVSGADAPFQCLRRLNGFAVSMGFARFMLSRGAPRLYNVSVSMAAPFWVLGLEG